ncbi:hypothetical protein BO94DRAFT_581099 [Aspergillus sclerotioniger CBS 115572]|uniref:Rhodopsin domain-containing protein n=1 Tax=Aspergillus sclerotioniger CBS 115572 TaxID=1450535 RepID=A0A317XBD6_9EURO|nr:hypothetical protein BO94DRAFT_581099 [Aspergillus sclerotioniger CBS 115572]PWY95944.1 hypothetical protein BO94DRAFT_581099 [Aspergillus sclerotioniger CBS 115572]
MAVDPAIVAIFGSPPSNLDLADSRVLVDNAVAGVILSLAVISVLLRFVARHLLRNPLKADDWVIILALVFIFTTTGLCISGGFFGAGRHVWAMSIPDVVTLFKILFVYVLVYAAVCASAKLSILFFYRRVFLASQGDLSLRLSIYLGFFLTISYPIIIWVTMATACRPTSYFWTQFSGATGSCIDTNTFFLALGIINMLNDVIVLLIPFPQIAKLHMNRRKKLAISGILAVGVVACIASIARISAVDEFTKRTDITWTLGPVFIWSTVEPGLSIVCACLPHLAPLVRLAHIKLSSSQDSKPSRPTHQSTPWRSRSGHAAKPSPKNKFNLSGYDDEICLTNHVTTSTSLRKQQSIESVTEGNQVQAIVVHSSLMQSVSNT